MKQSNLNQQEMTSPNQSRLCLTKTNSLSNKCNFHLSNFSTHHSNHSRLYTHPNSSSTHPSNSNTLLNISSSSSNSHSNKICSNIYPTNSSQKDIQQFKNYLYLNPWLSLTSMIKQDGAEVCSLTQRFLYLFY